MSNFVTTISVFVAGVAMTVLAAFISQGSDLNLGVGIGPREAGHFIGFIGMTCMMYFYATACSDNRVHHIMAWSHGIFIVAVCVMLFPSMRPAFVPQSFLRLMLTLSIYFIAFAVASRWWITKIATQTHILITTCVAMLAMSWSWELVVQPFFDVYGEPARGYIQWNQVATDAVAIFLTTAMLWFIGQDKASSNSVATC